LLASAIATVLIAILLASIATAQTPTATPSPSPTNALDIEVIGLRNDSGQVGCSIFNDAQAFPRDDSKVLRHVWAPIRGRKAVCEFTDLPAGQYAAVVFHDENGDHEFNMNAFEMPTEGYGFSNDAAALFAPPDFKSAAFNYNGQHLYIVINVRY
jgi:uncharacterized protein (DUF2141 family)